MLVPDINVLINAENNASSHYDTALRWFGTAANSDEPVGIPEMVLLGFARVTTGSGMGDSRIPTDRAFFVCQRIRSMPNFVRLLEGQGHWATFAGMVKQSGVSGRHLSDAYLAAFAIENDATFVTFDSGFIRFPGLKLLDLSA